ncbi:zinc finger and BTB domain-containing protein 41-like [Achroia grisella]|uniref:zinc finger and BTB domain-containing protein 41-like n=1 Tax=Achroia grisella TaxID=688607 RepID=UPI0027D33BC4|nr:zinc finger and BTB domain-containing protein 41-like [Achroia grisella]
MEQDVDNGYRTVCSACLSSDRDLFSICNLQHVYEMFRLLTYDFPVDRVIENKTYMQQLVCWECLAILKRFARFKKQVHNAQEHLRVLAISSTQESMDHTYMSQSLSSLEMLTKVDYDKIYLEYAQETEWPQDFMSIATIHDVKSEQYDVAQAVRDNINLDIDDHMLEVPEIVLENPVTGVMSHIVVGSDALVSRPDMYDKEETSMVVETLTSPKVQSMIAVCRKSPGDDERGIKSGYVTEYMTEAEMLAYREEAKLKLQYASSVYKCELCIIGFYSEQQVEDHFVSAHRVKPGRVPCKVCYVYVDEGKLSSHVDEHYLRRTCRLCGHTEYSTKLMQLHMNKHTTKQVPNTVIKIGDSPSATGKGRKKKESKGKTPRQGDLRKLLSKTTIEGYQCLECDMFFKNSRARKNHVARFHREGLQCDHCKKRFVNRTTLATHLRLHEGPLPRSECPICHKMVRVIQLKYHIRRHENKSRYECTDCNKVFSHLTTYQAHLKFSRAHASDQVFKFPCPMCNKGYPTKEAMQDHFNYQHLGKTAHKCPVCDKPIASRAYVEKHMMRVHSEKKEKPRNHVCQTCGKAFTDKKALTQHEVIHSSDRPLSCDICQQSFKQKASLYTHRKRVHKVYPVKRVVEFMDSTKQEQ